MEQFFRNKSIMKSINKWKIHLLIVLVLSVAIGAFISSPIIITPLFKSDAIIYPVNSFVYSEESTTEQMLQILRSSDIKIQMLDAFRLDKHYKINRNSPAFLNTFLNKYDQYVSISKTEYEAVQINVMDKDPVIASNMVDSIIKFYNLKIESLIKDKHREMLTITNHDLELKKKEMDSLETILKKWNQEYNIVDVKSQISGIANSNGGINSQLFQNLKDKGVDYKRTDSLLTNVRKEYIGYKLQGEKSRSEINKNISYTQIVSHPFPADKKAFPVRWLIVFMTTFASLLFAVIVISLIESNKKNKV